MENDYFERFLEHNDGHANLPAWVNEENSSKAAYIAIQALYKKKLHYIKKHSKKEHYKRKSSYQMSKSEVARAIGKAKPNAIFHSVDYARQLTHEFNEKNEALLAAFINAIKRNRKGKQGYTKKKLICVLQETEEELKVLSEQTVEEVLERSINRMSMPVRRLLGLD